MDKAYCQARSVDRIDLGQNDRGEKSQRKASITMYRPKYR